MNMTIEEYRTRLYSALAGFDQNEVRQAVDYYIELIEDADDPAEQMTKLGTPEQLAERIIKENGWSRPQFAGSYGYQNNSAQPGAYDRYDSYDRGSRKSKDPGPRIAALILTSPLWLSVFIIIIWIILTLWLVFISLPAGTAAAIFESLRWIGRYFGYSMSVFFAGVALAGLAVLLFAPVRAATKGLFITLKKFCRFLFGRSKDNSDHDFKNVKSYFSRTAIMIGALLTIAGTGVSVPLFAKAANNPDKFTQALGLENYEYTFNGSADSIKIDIKSGADLCIKQSEAGKGAYLKCENVKKDMISVTDSAEIGFTYDYTRNGGNVTFFNIGNVANASTRFYLYLPEKEYDSADIKLSLGDVKMNSFTARNISTECSCGDAKFTGVKQTTSGGSFIVNNDLGDIKLENCVMDGAANITQHCGDIKLIGVKANGLTAVNDLGDVSLENCTLDGAADITQHTGDIKLNSGKVNKLTAVNDLGDIKLESMTADVLDFTASCGDIKFSETAVTGSINCSIDVGSAKLELKGKDYHVTGKTDIGDVKINGEKAEEANAGGKIPVTVTNNTGDIKVNFN